MTKKTIAIALTCASVLSLTMSGCGAKTKTDNKGETSATVVAESTQTNPGTGSKQEPPKEELVEPWAYSVDWNNVQEKETDITFMGTDFTLPLKFESLLLHVTDLDFKCMRKGEIVELTPEEVPTCEESLISSEYKKFAIDEKPFRISLYDTESRPLKDIVSEERFELSIEGTKEIFGMDESEYDTPAEFLDALLEKYGSPSYVCYYETAKDTSPQFIWERDGYGFGLTYLDISSKEIGSDISNFTSFYYSKSGLEAFIEFCTGPQSKQRLVDPEEYVSEGPESTDGILVSGAPV